MTKFLNLIGHFQTKNETPTMTDLTPHKVDQSTGLAREVYNFTRLKTSCGTEGTLVHNCKEHLLTAIKQNHHE